MSRLAAIQRALPEDWPDWAARIVSDEAPVLAAELAKPWADAGVAVEASLRSIEKQLARSLKKGDVEAEEQWWDRLDAWLDGLNGSIGREALHAMTSWDEARYLRNPRVTVEPVERRRITANGEDYRGEHRAPGRGDAPLWNLTGNGVYPDDVYSPMGPQYYGIGDGSDAKAWAVVVAAYGKPTRAIKIYRAVPKMAPASEQIADLEAQKRYILKHGKIPKGVTTYQTPSAYYEMIHRSLDSLRKQAEQEGKLPEEPLQINPGDWVTIDRKYAVDHGEHSLGGKGRYVVLSKTVPASTLFTDGNSILEWGYNP